VDPSSFTYSQNNSITFTDRLGLQTAQEYAFGEFREWCRDPVPPPGLADAVASVGAVCQRTRMCAHMSGANSTGADRTAWNNIINATGGIDRSGGANFMCVGSQNCCFVHRCYTCRNGNPSLIDRQRNLTPSGTVNVGSHTIYFYRDELNGWCNRQNYRTGCRCSNCPR